MDGFTLVIGISAGVNFGWAFACWIFGTRSWVNWLAGLFCMGVAIFRML
jgi:hypothetical protein